MGFISSLRSWLQHPLTRGLDVDSPRTTILRQQIIRQKKFLQKIYDEWYRILLKELPQSPGRLLELGSGAGYLKEFAPSAITSDTFAVPNIDAVLDGCYLPFANNSLCGIVMTDVLHHIPQPRMFFSEAWRCVGPQGVLAMIEPWVTSWSSLIYSRFHHEPFQPQATSWEFPLKGPLSGANGALPWIMFSRDRAQFEAEMPGWKIRRIQPLMPFSYLVSGGVSMRSLMPGWSYSLWRSFENMLASRVNQLGMFALIVLEKRI
jgi:SAM-dependent methyltransferase